MELMAWPKSKVMNMKQIFNDYFSSIDAIRKSHFKTWLRLTKHRENILFILICSKTWGAALVYFPPSITVIGNEAVSLLICLVTQLEIEVIEKTEHIETQGNIHCRENGQSKPNFKLINLPLKYITNVSSF